MVPSALIVGFTSRDGTAAFYGTAPTLGAVRPDARQTSQADYSRALRSAWAPYAGYAERVAAEYELDARDPDPSRAFVQQDADAYVACPQLELARLFQNASAKNADSLFLYEFASPSATDDTHFLLFRPAPSRHCPRTTVSICVSFST